ncbi:helix-turn-helix transcriptional regulator [Ramlibacter henchirensis]|uniref:Helix-turn-helix transcriptional regulator n=1 Tax=Ramlibacter henchirensis TaxID=204072 RepID=A0A4Z0BUL8_9BURK|nr:helix-turn-helix transcriptional regulator [Ramlibacter henchirensis]TFZ02164.1 helix-turn-helix transcriptional regulator [Ramlibacter henchirensis]
MDLSDASFQRLIDLVYEAVEHPDRWRRFYEELQPAIGVKSVHMLALDKRHGTLSYSDGANLPVQGELAYMQHYRTLDPRLPVILERAPAEWTHCHEILDESVVARHPFYQEFLLPYDRRYMSATKLVDTPDATIILATLSGQSQGPLTAEAVRFVDRLMPHLQRACRIGLQNFVYSSQALVGHMLVNKLRQPVILMTSGGHVMHSNEAARDLLRSTKLVAVEDGRLRLPSPHLQQLLEGCATLEQAFKTAQAGSAESGGTHEASGSQFRSLRITEGPRAGDALYAFYSLLLPGSVMGTFGLRPVVMLLFYHPSSAPPIDSGLLYAVFGLTPAECRIATMLAEGLSLKQIADAQGTQHETVRKQLRSIYQKTSTNRQPELVRLLLHLPHNAVQD